MLTWEAREAVTEKGIPKLEHVGWVGVAQAKVCVCVFVHGWEGWGTEECSRQKHARSED